MKRLFVLFWMLAGMFKVHAVTTNDVAANWAQIKSALANAGEGDTIRIAAGNVTDADTIAVCKANTSFRILGSGTNNTFISGNASIILQIASNSTNLFEIAGITFTGKIGNTFASIYASAAADTAVIKGPIYIHDCAFPNTERASIDIGGGGGTGLIYHCSFANRVGSAGNEVVVHGNGWTSWVNQSNPMGTTNLVQIESCTFSHAGGNGHMDGYNGANSRYVDCDFDGPGANGVHGYDSQPTSCRYSEMYNCRFNTYTGGNLLFALRGGVGIWLNNTCTGSGLTTNGINWLLQNYRAGNTTILQSSSLGFVGYDHTNLFSGVATGGSSTTLLDANRGPELYKDMSSGWTLYLVSGTGSGQSATITNHPLGQYTITGGTFSPAPDATTHYEIGPTDLQSLLVGFQPVYTFTTNISTHNFNRYVLLGATRAETWTNLFSCINRDPAGSGVKYAAVTSTTASGKQTDVTAVSLTATTLVTHNFLDGAGFDGYPSCQQPGMLWMTKYTNSPSSVFGCYSSNNMLNGTAAINFELAFKTLVGDNGYTNVLLQLQEGRDFFSNQLPPGYTQIPFPHPLVKPYPLIIIASSTPNSGATVNTTPDNSNVSIGTTPFTNTYLPGQLVTFTANATTNYNFVKWTRTDTNNVTTDASTNVIFTNIVVDPFYSKYTAVFTAPGGLQPTISTIADITGKVGHLSASSSFTVGDPVNNANTLVMIGNSSDQSILPDINIFYGGSGSNRTVALTGINDGVVTVTNTVINPTGQSASTNLTATIVGNSITLSRPTKLQSRR